MALAFNLALHVLLLGSLLLFLISVVALSLTTKNVLERGLRIAALFAGAMVSLGAQASGVSYATFTVDALAGARPASASAHVVATVIPALMGAGIGFFMARTMRRHTTLAIRLMAFIGMLAVTAFLQVYAEAASLSGFKLGAAALPNIGFTAGVILTVVLTMKTEDEPVPADRSVLRSMTSWMLNQRARSAGAANAAPISGRDPFDTL